MVYPLTVPLWNSLLPSEVKSVLLSGCSLDACSNSLHEGRRRLFQSGMVSRTRHSDSPRNVLCRQVSKRARLLTEILHRILAHEQRHSDSHQNVLCHQGFKRAKDSRHYYYCLRGFVSTKMLLSSDKTLLSLDCGGFVVVERNLDTKLPRQQQSSRFHF
jgi:hypothetical protein